MLPTTNLSYSMAYKWCKYFLLIVILFSCNSKGVRSHDSVTIIKQTIGDFLSNFSKDSEKDTVIFIRVEVNGKIKQLSISHVIDSSYLDSPSELELARKVLDGVDERISFGLEGYQYAKIRIFENTNINSHYFNHRSYIGTIIVSNVFFNDSKTLGSYYLAVNCGNNCSAGFLIFVEPANDSWVISKAVLLWHG